MLFLFGERVHGTAMEAGERQCGVCARRTSFSRIIETNYFCVFGLRILPIERVADYLSCNECGSAFETDTEEPSHIALVKRVVTYIMLGYGMQDHREIAREICEKVTGFDFPDDQLREMMRDVDAGREDVFETLKRRASTVNAVGKRQIVEAAFLMTHACCEIQHEDRLRINLIGNVLGVSLQFVEACIEDVRSKRYLGIRRLLSTRTL